MNALDHVLVLAGGLSHEREVSLRSGRRVCEGLRGLDIEVTLQDADSSLLPRIRANRPDAVFPALHGLAGEDGAVRAVLELLRIPYVGARPDACRVAFDKPAAKGVARAAGLDTPPSVALPRETFHDLGASSVMDRIVAHLELPLFVKPSRGGSSLGGNVVWTADELPSALIACFGYSNVALVERYITGTELAVTVLDTGDGPVALPSVEIVPAGDVYDYAARYTAGHTGFFAPARVSGDVETSAREAALVAHRALGLRDLSRTDIIVTQDRKVHFLEVNVAPGMTETSTLPMALDAGGIEFGALCRDIIVSATARET